MSVGTLPRRCGALVAALVFALAACGSVNPTPRGPSSATQTAIASLTPSGPPTIVPGIGLTGPTPAPLSPAYASLAYGTAPVKDPAVTYQPDVVFVQGGSAAIRWASEDGFTWGIDAGAAGAADLKVGSVMFATNVAVGRVVAVADQGSVRVVTIEPIALTELVRDADLHLDAQVDLSAAAYRPTPPGMPVDESGAAADGPSPSPSAAGDVPTPSRTVAIELPAIQLAAVRRPAGATAAASPAPLPLNDINLGHGLSVPLKTCPALGIGDWSVKACLQGQGVQVNVDYKRTGLKFGAVLTLLAKNLHVQAGTVVKDGQMVSSGGLLDGIDSIGVKFAAGVEDGAQDNVKVKFEVPLEAVLGTQVVDGIPLTEVMEFKLSIETAFSGKNSTMSGSGQYALTGPMGYVDGTTVSPTVTVDQSLLDSLSGITIGASGVVIGVKFKVQGGIGLPAFLVGPYLSLTFSVGVGKGSVIGAALAECKGATLGIWFGAGAGFNVSPGKLGWLSKTSFFRNFSSMKFELDALQYQLFSRKVVTPDVPLCRG